MVLQKLEQADSMFSRAEVAEIIGMFRPTAIAATILCYKRSNPHLGYVVCSEKAAHPRMAGGTVLQTETTAEAAKRELLEEIPRIIPHVDTAELKLFTVAEVFPSGTEDDGQFVWRMSKFFEGATMPSELFALMREIKIPLIRGFDFIYSIPVDGEPPVGIWQSEEAVSAEWMDFRHPELAWYLNEVAAEWVCHVDSGYTYQPPLEMRFLRPGGVVLPT